MAFQLGKDALVTPSQQMQKNTPVTGVGIHKRAYASLKLDEVSDSLVGCSDTIKQIESSTVRTSLHSGLMGDEDGRLAPKPVLESLTINISCKDAIFKIFGVSLSGWNTFISLLIVIISLRILFYEKNK